MPSELSEHAVERSTYVITAAFTDEDDNAVAPIAIAWSLKTIRGEIINSRDGIALTPATAVDIVLTGADLAIPDTEDKKVIVELVGTYDSNAGAGLNLTESVTLSIDPL